MEQIKCLFYMALSFEFLLLMKATNTGNHEDWVPAGKEARASDSAWPHVSFTKLRKHHSLNSKRSGCQGEFKWQTLRPHSVLAEDSLGLNFSPGANRFNYSSLYGS